VCNSSFNQRSDLKIQQTVRSVEQPCTSECVIKHLRGEWSEETEHINSGEEKFSIDVYNKSLSMSVFTSAHIEFESGHIPVMRMRYTSQMRHVCLCIMDLTCLHYVRGESKK
jgi:hypothetical protein